MPRFLIFASFAVVSHCYFVAVGVAVPIGVIPGCGVWCCIMRGWFPAICWMMYRSLALSSCSFVMVSVSCLLPTTSFSAVLLFCTAALATLLSEVIICVDHCMSSTVALAWDMTVPPVRHKMSHCLLKAAVQWFFQLSHAC